MSFIWLSHKIENETPLYGGRKDAIYIKKDQRMSDGASCNTSTIELPSHAGTHVDAPLHFIPRGRSVSDYSAGEWVFRSVFIARVQAVPCQIIQPEDIIEDIPEETELVLFQTGFEEYRGQETYWKENPGLSPEMTIFLKEKCTGIQAVGMDFISISSLSNRNLGRRAHKAFLESGIRIVEDMNFTALKTGMNLSEVICLPMRFSGDDGSPCTIIGRIAD